MEAIDNFIRVILIIVCFLLFMWAITIGGRNADGKWEREVIEKGYAEYHNVTGKWQWKEK